MGANLLEEAEDESVEFDNAFSQNLFTVQFQHQFIECLGHWPWNAHIHIKRFSKKIDHLIFVPKQVKLCWKKEWLSFIGDLKVQFINVWKVQIWFYLADDFSDFTISLIFQDDNPATNKNLRHK